jgi:predicted tellurium resistance membrane protein TerC
MKLKLILIFCAVVVSIFALGYMVFPAQVFSYMGYSTDTTGLLILQFVGVLSMGYVASIWHIRDAEKEVQKPTIFSAMIAMGCAFVVSLIHQLAGTFGALGWIGVGNFGLAFLVFGYYWFFKM